MQSSAWERSALRHATFQGVELAGVDRVHQDNSNSQSHPDDMQLRAIWLLSCLQKHAPPHSVLPACLRPEELALLTEGLERPGPS